MDATMMTLWLMLSFKYGVALNYVNISLPFDEASRYCRTFGSDLAAVAIDDDRDEAISLMGTDEVAWTGLYTKGCIWKFLDEQECSDENSAFRCVDFWLYKLNENTRYRPRCIGDDEGGYPCSYFNSVQNGMDNDISCTQSLPFICSSDISCTEGTCDFYTLHVSLRTEWKLQKYRIATCKNGEYEECCSSNTEESIDRDDWKSVREYVEDKCKDKCDCLKNGE